MPEFIDLAVPLSPVVESPFGHFHPTQDLLGREFGSLVPVLDVIDDRIASFMGNPIHIHRRSFDFATALDWPQERLDQLIETVDAVRAIEGITFTTSNGGLAYSLEIRGDNGLFAQIVESLAAFETPVTV